MRIKFVDLVFVILLVLVIGCVQYRQATTTRPAYTLRMFPGQWVKFLPTDAVEVCACYTGWSNDKGEYHAPLFGQDTVRVVWKEGFRVRQVYYCVEVLNTEPFTESYVTLPRSE